MGDIRFTDDDVEAGAAYRYQVRALDIAHQSEPSNAVDVDVPGSDTSDQDLARPTNLCASHIHHNGVTLSWDSPEGLTVTGYQILVRDKDRDESEVFRIHVKDTGSADTSHTFDDLKAERPYVLRVKAHTGDGLPPAPGIWTWTPRQTLAAGGLHPCERVEPVGAGQPYRRRQRGPGCPGHRQLRPAGRRGLQQDHRQREAGAFGNQERYQDREPGPLLPQRGR